MQAIRGVEPGVTGGGIAQQGPGFGVRGRQHLRVHAGGPGAGHDLGTVGSNSAASRCSANRSALLSRGVPARR